MKDNFLVGRIKRKKSILKTSGYQIFSKIIAAFVQLATVPLVLNYLGKDVYGLWVVLASLIAYLQVSDIGIGNALIGLTSKHNKESNKIEVVMLLFKSIAIVASISLILYIVISFFIDGINWQKVLNFSDPSNEMAIEAVKSYLLMFCIGLPLALIQQVRLGSLEGHINSIYSTLGFLLNLALIYIGIKNNLGIPNLIIMSMLGTIIFNFINMIEFVTKILRDKKNYFSKKKNIKNKNLYKDVMVRGMPFFLLQIMGLVAYQSDTFIISHYTGIDNVAEYSVTAKLFALPIVLLGVVLNSTWPAYSNAFEEKDYEWIKEYFWKSLKKSILIMMPVAIVIALLSSVIIRYWTGGILAPTTSLVLCFTAITILNPIGGNLSTVMNGVHLVWFQVISAIFGGVINLTISIFLVKNIGISGPILGTLITQSMCYFLTYMYLKKKQII